MASIVQFSHLKKFLNKNTRLNLHGSDILTISVFRNTNWCDNTVKKISALDSSLFICLEPGLEAKKVVNHCSNQLVLAQSYSEQIENVPIHSVLLNFSN